MTSVPAARVRRRSSLAATASAALLRWPTRNHFAEVAASSPDQPHPVDGLLEQEPHLRRIARRTGRLLAKVQAQVKPADLLAFEAEQTLLDGARVAVAFNLGFENGLLLGRGDGLRQTAARSLDGNERALEANLRAALGCTRTSPDRTAALLLELAWAFVVGAPRTSRPGRARVSRQPR